MKQPLQARRWWRAPLQWIDLWIPKEIFEDELDALRKSRLLVGISLANVVLGCLSVVGSFFVPQAGKTGALMAGLMSLVLYSATLICLRVTRSNVSAGTLLSLGSLASLVIVNYLVGGFVLQTAYWSIFPPMIAMFLVGTRWGGICTFLVLLELTGFFLVKKYVPGALPTPKMLPIISFLQLSFILAFVTSVTFFVWVFETSRERAMEALSLILKKNHDLVVKQNILEATSQAKTEFLATMSHELRTPLNAVIGYSEILQEEFEEQGLQEFAPDVERIQVAGRHLLSLINDILDLTKIEAGKMDVQVEVFALAGLVEKLKDHMTPMLKEREISLKVVGLAGVTTMCSDATKIQQIILNLLSNAAKFSEGRPICLTVGETLIDEKAWISFEVRDEGIGISAEQMEHLFKMFSQADSSTTRRYGGTGLGLAISQRLCLLLGGVIEAKSQQGEGSAFTVRLPKIMALPSALSQPDSSPEPLSSSPATASDGVSRKRTVLVIDDDPDVLDLMTRFLVQEGYQVITTNSSTEGVRLARDLVPAAITIDVMMPDMDGWEVITQLRQDPVLASTVMIMLSIVDDQPRALALGADAYHTKPIDRQKLASLLRSHIAA